MEVKWTMIGLSVLFGSVFASMGFNSYQVNQCRVASVQAGMSADDISKLCK